MSNRSYKKWNEAELNFIRENSSTMKDSEMAVKLTQITGNTDISVAMVRRQRRKFGFKKGRGRPRKAPLNSQPQSTIE